MITIESIEFWGKHIVNDGGIEIVWSNEEGFGTFQYYLKDGKFHIADDEAMGIDFAEEVLRKALDIR
jgi:hypothetical protein